MKTTMKHLGWILGVCCLASCVSNPQSKTPQGQKLWVGVRSEATSIKEHQDASAKIVAKVQFGEPLTVLEEKGSWFRVHTTTGNEGWIHKLIVCDENILEGRKRSGQIPTAILLASGFKSETSFDLSILAGQLRADLTPVVGNCIAFEDEPILARVKEITAFKGVVLTDPKPSVLYYFGSNGEFVQIPR